MLQYPSIDPVFFRLGPLELRWYGLTYVLGIGLGGYFLRQQFKTRLHFSSPDLINFLTYIMIGVFLGGRIGYVILYDLSWFLQHPFELFAFWNGGMSFHGGFTGAGFACLLFGYYYKKNIWVLFDLTSIGCTFGLGFGRLANFINGELFGRISHVPWAMVFPNGGPLARHPSQLYEFFLEGVVLFFILFFLLKKGSLKKGQLMGCFMIFYGIFRIIVEFFREPDAHIGFLFQVITMGQLLSIGMIFVGMVVLALRHYEKT